MSGNRIAGAALVCVGFLMLLELVGIGFFGWTWSVMLLLLGGALLYSWIDRRDDSGKVFTGTLLFLLGVFFVFERLSGFDMAAAWPFFILSPGIALLVMSRVDPLRRDASVPGWIAIGIALLLYFFTTGIFLRLIDLIFWVVEWAFKVLVPLGLIGLGGWMLLGRRHGGGERDPIPEKVEPVAEVVDETGEGSESGSDPAPDSSPESAPDEDETSSPPTPETPPKAPEEGFGTDDPPLSEPPSDGEIEDADFEDDPEPR